MPIVLTALALCLSISAPCMTFTEVLSVGDTSTTWLSNVQSVSFLPGGSLVVSDKLDYQLKLLDRHGNLIRTVGRRGSRPGEFRGPGPVACHGGIVAVADFSSPRIQIFTADFGYKHSFQALGAVFALCFDAQGNLWAGVQTRDKTNELAQYHLSGALLRTVGLRNTTGGMFEDIYAMAISHSGMLVIAYVVQNKIEVWDTSGHFQREFSVPGVRQSPPIFSNGVLSEQLKVPQGNLLGSIAIDSNNRIFVLGADYSEHPGQDVYVLSLDGNHLTTALLPVRSPQIWIGPDGFLYSTVRERTVIKKYRIKYKGR